MAVKHFHPLRGKEACIMTNAKKKNRITINDFNRTELEGLLVEI